MIPAHAISTIRLITATAISITMMASIGLSSNQVIEPCSDVKAIKIFPIKRNFFFFFKLRTNRDFRLLVYYAKAV